jgi:hypothetical protein
MRGSTSCRTRTSKVNSKGGFLNSHSVKNMVDTPPLNILKNGNMKTSPYQLNALSKSTYLLISMVVLFISGCAGISHGPVERNADAAKERIHSMNREVIPELSGSWKLVSFHSQDSSGRISYPFGKDARGRITYEPNGRMAVQLMNPDRPRFTSDDPLVASETEVRAAFGEYTAYYGTYSVNPDEHTIVHHIEAALLPNWAGTDQRRHFEFDGKYLTLKGPLRLGGVQGVVSLVWERLP